VSARVGWVAEREGSEPWFHHLPAVEVVRDRGEWIAQTAAGLRVAHIGFVDQGCERTNAGRRWLHERLAARAEELVGFDVAEAGVRAARDAGYEGHVVDCTEPAAVAALGLEPFELVIAGEVIEHVDSPGDLLTGMRVLTGDRGRLLVTTPNATRLMDTVLAAARRAVVHPDHVAVYSVRTLTSLLSRHGWRVEGVAVYIQQKPRPETLDGRAAVLRGVESLCRAAARHGAPYLADGLIVLASPGGP
jgi:hypothetical protein